MPDIYRYIKKRKQQKKWHKMELYGLNCGFSGLIYNTIFFIAKKCKFSKIRKQNNRNHVYFPPAASNRYGLTDCYTKGKKMLCEEKGVI